MNESGIPNPKMQWQYGRLRSSQSWVLWVTLATGVLALPAAWILRDSLTLGRAPLPSWAVLLVGVLFSIIGLAVSASLLRARSRPPKLIAIANGKLTLPGSLVSGPGWSQPLSDIEVRTTDLGFVKQLQITGQRKRKTLSSALFESDSEFERLVSMLSSG